MTPQPEVSATFTSLPHHRGGSLLDYATPQRPLYYRHNDVEYVGIGEYRRFSATGARRFTNLAEQWESFVSGCEPDIRSSLVALGSGEFDPAGEATLIVPRTLIRRHGKETTIVTMGASVDDVRARPLGVAPVVEWPHIDSVYPDRVRTAMSKLGGTFAKVVVARAITGTVSAPGDERVPLARLASSYGDCHLFAIDGLWGASPETLISVTDRRVRARVLAGSSARGIDSASDAQAALALQSSTKDLAEHKFAVDSVVSALAAHCRSIVGRATPFALRLTNLWHLASDIEGVVSGRTSVLPLIDGIHPTAAVAGVPTEQALNTINEIEAIPRGRYAGPVGWVDGNGDGEWAIALRCAQWNDGTIVAYAGAGILADSHPESEFAETELKLRPVREALRLT